MYRTQDIKWQPARGENGGASKQGADKMAPQQTQQTQSKTKKKKLKD